VGELCDRLLDAVLKNLEVILREAGDEPAAGVGHCDRDLDDVDAAAEWAGLTPHAGENNDTAGWYCAASVVIHDFTRCLVLPPRRLRNSPAATGPSASA